VIVHAIERSRGRRVGRRHGVCLNVRAHLRRPAATEQLRERARTTGEKMR
jgi:hypothetical protein